MKRRFEFAKGSSSKFYEVNVAGSTVQITYGRIGTAGQTQQKVFVDAATAHQHAEGLIRQKLAKGYREQPGVPAC